jgi:hypothetical protein
MIRALKTLPLRATLLAFSTIISGGLAVDALKGEVVFEGWFPALKDYKIYVTILILFLFGASLILLVYYRKDFIIRTLAQTSCTSHNYLILSLTAPNTKIVDMPSPFKFPLTLSDKKGNTATLNGTDLKGDINELNKLDYWNWQQVMRGIEPHANLKYVYIIGSKDSAKMQGSSRFLKEAELLINQYHPKASIQCLNTPVDFEDFDELVNALEEAIRFLKEHGAQEKDIIIDVTGGQKTASIAGAVVTLTRETTFQYVRTNPKYNDVRDVLAYDVAAIQPPQAGI